MNFSQFSSSWLKKNKKISLLISLFAVIYASCFFNIGNAKAGMLQVVESRLTSDSFDHYNPSISGDKIVWEEYQNDNYDIYMYDIAADHKTQITTDTSNQYNAIISGDKIVWEDYRNGNADIYFYDISNDNETRITNADTDHSNFSPFILDNKIVWEEYSTSTSSSDIYLYDIVSEDRIKISNISSIAAENEYNSGANISGNRIVYYKYAYVYNSGTDNWDYISDIYLYNISNGEEIRITESGKANDPSISGDKIVWAGDTCDEFGNNCFSDIYMYDIPTGDVSKITTGKGVFGSIEKNAYNPFISGDKIVWDDDTYYPDTDDEYDDVHMYDLTREVEEVITTSKNTNNPVISGDRIVWYDYRGDYADIYLATFSYDESKYKFEDSFDTTDNKDDVETDASWDTAQGKISLPIIDQGWKYANKITNGSESIYPEIGNTDSLNTAEKPKMVLDSAGNPSAVWVSGYSYNPNQDIIFTKWNGTAWTNADSTTLGSENISHIAQSYGLEYGSIEPQLVLDQFGRPMIVWVNYYSEGGQLNVHFMRWNGSQWTGMDGITPGPEELAAPGGINSRSPMITLDHNNNPVVVWNEDNGDGSYDIYLTRWNGSAWTYADGETGGSEVIASNSWYELSDVKILINSNNEPAVAWEETDDGRYYINYSKWSIAQENWVDAYDEMGYGRVNVSDIYNWADFRFALGQNDHPIFTWVEEGWNEDVMYTQWSDANGGDWAKADGTTYGDEIISGDPGGDVTNGNSLNLALDSLGRPLVSWLREVDDIPGEEAYFTRWNGSQWTNADGITSGEEFILTEASDHINNLKMITYGNQPIISAIIDGDLFVKHFDGNQWVGMDGNSSRDQLSNTGDVDYNAANDAKTEFILDQEGNPVALWFDSSFAVDDLSPQIFFSRYVDIRTSQAQVQSTKLNGAEEGIVSATLTADDYIPGAATIQYYLSNNGGGTWEAVNNGENFNFDSSGNDLRWRAILTRGSIPVINSVNIIYLIQTESVVDSICGSSNGKKFTTAPINNLCLDNSLPILSGNGPWNWTCLGVNGGENSSCSAQKAKKSKDGKCGDSDGDHLLKAPTKNFCKSGDRTKIKGDGPWTWKCEGENGGDDDSCKADKKEVPIIIPPVVKDPIDGLCGISNNQSLSEKPIDTLCANGKPSTVSGSGPWDWSCQGFYGGKNVACQAIKSQISIETPPIEPTIPVQKPVQKNTPIVSKKESNHVAETASIAAIALGMAAGISLALSSSGVPLLPTSPNPIADSFAFFGILGKSKRKNNDWGVVFDAETRAPIKDVVVTILNKDGKVIDSTATDAEGRYGFLANEGEYVLKVSRNNYEIEKGQTQDEFYGDIYDGESFAIIQNEMAKKNIAMKIKDVNWKNFAQRKVAAYTSIFSIFKKNFFIILFYVGFIVTGGAVYISPTVINIVLFVVYGGIVVHHIFFKDKSFGNITDEMNKPIPFAIVSLYDEQEPARRISFAVSDVVGRYYLLAKNGFYLMKVQGQEFGGHSFVKTFKVNVKDGVVKNDITV